MYPNVTFTGGSPTTATTATFTIPGFRKGKAPVNIVKKNGGQATLTNDKHFSGSDRVYKAYLKKLESKVDLIINLQGDMPSIKPNSIIKLEKLMRNNNCDIGTLASYITNKEELNDTNIVKLKVDEDLNNDNFLDVRDFFRKTEDLNNKKLHKVQFGLRTKTWMKTYN